jgi:hypothetical protein
MKNEPKYPKHGDWPLLHFKYMSFDFFFERRKQLLNTLRSHDIKGVQYTFDEEELRKEWENN